MLLAFPFQTFAYLWLGVLLVLFLFWARNSFVRTFHSNWYKPPGYRLSDRYNWKDIEYILTNDPLEHTVATRWPESKDIVLLQIKTLIWLLFFFMAIVFIAFPETTICKSAVQMPSFDVTLAVAVGIATAITATNELRAKVRSENRQRWINDVRDTIAEVLDHIQTTNFSSRTPIREGKANISRLRLEMLLNPAEKDHRTLGSLLQLGYGLQSVEHLDNSVRSNVSLVDHVWNFFGSEDDRSSHEFTNQWNFLITYIIRLSNALLKREWELVKYGR